MKAYLTSHRAAVAVVAGVVVAVSFSGVALAITDTVFRYSAPKVGYFPISAMAMNASSDNYDYMNHWFGGLAPAGSPSLACFSTGVNLPQGATINALTIYYKSGSTGDISASFYRFQLSDGTFDKIGERIFVGNTAGLRKAGAVPIRAAFAAVNNAQFSYGLGVCLDSNAEVFHDARIQYTYNNAGD